MTMPIAAPALPTLSLGELKKIRKDPEKTAEAVGLHYIDCKIAPGYGRKGAGKGFFYINEKGERCKDKRKIKRMNALVIPPPGKMFGSVKMQRRIYRRRASTKRAASSTATTTIGLKSEITPSTSNCCALPRPCLPCASKCSTTCVPTATTAAKPLPWPYD